MSTAKVLGGLGNATDADVLEGVVYSSENGIRRVGTGKQTAVIETDISFSANSNEITVPELIGCNGFFMMSTITDKTGNTVANTLAYINGTTHMIHDYLASNATGYKYWENGFSFDLSTGHIAITSSTTTVVRQGNYKLVYW